VDKLRNSPPARSLSATRLMFIRGGNLPVIPIQAGWPEISAGFPRSYAHRSTSRATHTTWRLEWCRGTGDFLESWVGQPPAWRMISWSHDVCRCCFPGSSIGTPPTLIPASSSMIYTTPPTVAPRDPRVDRRWPATFTRRRRSSAFSFGGTWSHRVGAFITDPSLASRHGKSPRGRK
jgi:hypothetical protein